MLPEQLRDAELIGRSDDQIDAVAAPQFFGIDLGVTPGRHHPRRLAAAQHPARQGAHAAVGVVGNGAGVDHVHLGRFVPFHTPIAGLLEGAGDGGGFGEIQLAP